VETLDFFPPIVDDPFMFGEKTGETRRRLWKMRFA